MSILEELYGTSPVNLNELIETETLTPLPIPEASVRNRAASVAISASSPERLVEDYQAIMLENESGQTVTLDKLRKEGEAADKPMDMKAVLEVLGDNSLDVVAKMEAVKAINSGFYKDTATKLQTNAAAAPSKTVLGDENVEQESVRIVGMENQLRDTFDYRQAVQAMRNKHGAGLNSETTNAFTDLLETILPFATNVRSAKTLVKIKQELGLPGNKVWDTIWAGSTTESIRDALASVPPSERHKVIEPIKRIVEANSGIIFKNDNDFNEWTTMNQIFDEGGYSSFDKWLDNAVGVLDVVGLGGVVKGGVKGLSKLFKRTPEAVEENVARTAITGNVQPSAPANVVAASNPEKARSMYALAVRSEGDEVSKALYGVSREEAVTQQVVPQIVTVDGSVPARVVDIDRDVSKVIDPDVEAVEAFYSNGATYFTPGEKAAAAARVNDVFSGTGLHMNDAMTQIGVDGGQVVVKATYGGVEGGFVRAEDAVKQAEFALRDYGVTTNNITVLKKIDSDYIPVTLDEVKGVDGDYLIQVNTKHNINPSDIFNMEEFDVKRNLFARIPHTFMGVFGPKSGSFNRWVFDAASMFRPELSGSAVVASDRAVAIDKALLKLHDSFATKFRSLSGERQNVLFEHIKEANFKGLELSDSDLLARGFGQMEIEALHDWRKAWDTHFWFENADLGRSLSIQGYKLFENNNARLFAKEIQKNQNIGKVYDPATDSVVTLSRQELDDLYDKGGYYAKLRRPIDIDGNDVEVMVVRNTPNEYLRGLTENDQVLNYRKGYYQIQYTAPKYLEKIVRDKNGKELYRKVVAYGNSTEDVARYRERAARAEGVAPEQWGDIRGDVHQFATDSDKYWDLQSASGRVAQRHRGKQLEDASAPVNVSQGQYILDPVESAIRAARSLSGRVSARSFLETSKQRAIRQYEKFFPKNQYQQPEWPTDASKLLSPGNATTKEIAAARSTVEYINYLENGYINTLDEAYKATMNGMANMLAGLGTKSGERAFNYLGEFAPTSLGKNWVFQAYIATNPHRQWLIQTHGGIRLLAYNPSYILSMSEHLDIVKYIIGKLNKETGMISKPPKGAKDIVDWVDSTGMLSSVDRHNLVRGALTDMVDSHNLPKRWAGKALALPRKIGFDAAEQTNLLNHLLVVRDKYAKAGKNVNDKAVKDAIVAEARAIAYNMNFAGDMPYNQNWAALFMQFAQVPHKAFLQYTNITIPFNSRMKLMAMDMLMFGVPGGMLINSLIPEDMLPADSDLRNDLIDGITMSMYNEALTNIAGEDVKIDFSGLSPFEMDGWAKLATAIWSGGWSDIFTNSPAANIFLKEDSRVREAVVRLGRYTGFFDPYEGHEPETLKGVVDGVLSISSGWTNWQKAKFIAESGKIVDKQGRPMAENTAFMYAVAQAFGFSSLEQARFYAANNELSKEKKAWREEVESWYKGYVRLLSREQQLTTQDPEYVTKVLGMAKMIYKDDYKALEIISQNLERDVVANDMKIIRNALQAAGIKGSREWMQENERYFQLDEEKKNAWKLIRDIQRKQEEE